MTHRPLNRPLTCDTAQDAIQARRDGVLPADEIDALDAHLLTCDECREFDAALDAIGEVLRSLPVAPMPEPAVAAVLERTADVQSTRGTIIHRFVSWPAAAVAAALLFVAWVGPFAPRREASQTHDAQVALAASEAEFVLALTGQVLARVEQQAFDQVIGEHVSPALKRIPFRLP